MARAKELFADEGQIMKSLYQEYNKRNDLDAVAKIEQDLKDIYETCSAREVDARQVIKGLSERVQELQGAAAYPHHEGLHAERLNALQREVDLANRLIQELDTQARSDKRQQEQLADQLIAVKSAASAEAAAREAEVLFLRQVNSMYTSITNVKWRQSEPHVVSGFVSDCKNGDIRRFKFNPQTVDHFKMVNDLWDLL